MKNTLKGKHLAGVEEVKPKHGRSTARREKQRGQKLLRAVEKRLGGCVASHEEDCEGDCVLRHMKRTVRVTEVSTCKKRCTMFNK